MRNYTALTHDETVELIQTQEEFPFSQVIHSLAAKGAITNNLSVKDKKLQTAAVYATDRAVLKLIATAAQEERKQAPMPKPELDKVPLSKVKPSTGETKKKSQDDHSVTVQRAETVQADSSPTEVQIESKSTKQAVHLSGDQLIDELYHDLDKLKHLKHDYEVMVEDLEKPAGKAKPVPLAALPAPEKKSDSKPKKRKSEGDGIIDQIKSTKKKIKPSDPKQKEQLDIINQFIKSKPNFAKQASVDPEPDKVAPDLSESSNAFSENVVSETLVEILIKQGKKEKAVEVLKKLIWKFPQKKTYFAAQIEELKS